MGLYLRPKSLAEALDMLGPEGPAEGGLTILAGATHYYPARVGRPLDDDILDIAGIAELGGIERRDDHVRIGALVTWSALAEADLPPCFDGLKQAGRAVGGVQVRNVGTLCGNLCQAESTADGVPPLLTLDAGVELASVGAVETVALGDFLLGEGRTARRPEQMVTAVLVPTPQGRAVGGFARLAARACMARAIVAVAAVVEADAAGRVADAKVAVSGCSPLARRLPGLEDELAGRSFDGGLGAAVTPQHLASLSARADEPAGADDRRETAQVLLGRLLSELGGRG